MLYRERGILTGNHSPPPSSTYFIVKTRLIRFSASWEGGMDSMLGKSDSAGSNSCQLQSPTWTSSITSTCSNWPTIVKRLKSGSFETIASHFNMLELIHIMSNINIAYKIEFTLGVVMEECKLDLLFSVASNTIQKFSQWVKLSMQRWFKCLNQDVFF